MRSLGLDLSELNLDHIGEALLGGQNGAPSRTYTESSPRSEPQNQASGMLGGSKSAV